MCANVAAMFVALELITGSTTRTKLASSSHGGPTGRGVVRKAHWRIAAPFDKVRNLCKFDNELHMWQRSLARPTQVMTIRTLSVRGMTYVCKKEKETMTPHIRCHEPQPIRIPWTQTTKSGCWEASRFRLPGYRTNH